MIAGYNTANYKNICRSKGIGFQLLQWNVTPPHLVVPEGVPVTL